MQTPIPAPNICPICHKAPEGTFQFKQNHSSSDGFFSLYECPLCAVQFWMPFRNPGPEWYSTCEQNLRHRASHDISFLLWMAQNRAITKHFLRAPVHTDPSGLKLLDVGCGTGGFLSQAQRLGYDVHGVDFDLNQIETARSLELPQTTAQDIFTFLTEFRNHFDVITGFEVIEHLDKPKDFLRLTYQALKPGGFLCLSTPNRRRMGPRNEFWDFPFHHLTRWDKDSLTTLIREEGYKNIRVTEELPLNYFVSKFRFGFATFIRNIQARKTGQVYSREQGTPKHDGVGRIAAFKDWLVRIVFSPVALLLFALGYRAQGLYIVAEK